MVLGKKVTIFYWEWARNSVPRDGQKRPCSISEYYLVLANSVDPDEMLHFCSISSGSSLFAEDTFRSH